MSKAGVKVRRKRSNKSVSNVVHGVPPPARGIRNTGEQAMLDMPEHACGVYIGFVGPA